MTGSDVDEYRYVERRVRDLLAKGWSRASIVRRLVMEVRRRRARSVTST